ncbi:heat-inducible transcription repressor [Rhynchospora pubera]|uniref:Heat-inducible transcription repressor n=1 Tax=Rhynchospora pubera TaxID=906938 RepID=A0AAV8CR23_9POAL|nr:heat-inducible transcription repressor [Rhynchospora pubera]
MDMRPNQSNRLRRHLYNTSTVPGQIGRHNHRKSLREHLYSPSTLTTDQEASFFANLTAKDGGEPRRKRQHVQGAPSGELSGHRRDMQISGHVVNHTGLKKSQAQHATAKMKNAWALLREDLNYAKSQLNITQARCEQLQEENRCLRNNVPDEDSLLRCEVEMLLANKSQLNLDKANLMKEKERLLQLVEYLQKGSPSVEDE